MNFSSKEYLPNSKKRIERLRKIVRGRHVVVLAAGPSINELEHRISELREADICYFGFNRFVQERHILQQIKKNLSVFMNSTQEHINLYFNDIISFLDREEDNLFVSSFWRDTFKLMPSNFNLNQFLQKYDEKLLFFGIGDHRTFPNENYPLHFPSGPSLMLMIQLAIIGKASSIVLFGADGGFIDHFAGYYRKEEYKPWPDASEALIWDTHKAFNPRLPILMKNIYRLYKLSTIDILNCSKNSLYTPFPKISYDNAFEYLLRGKKFNRVWDLRIPKVSVISLSSNNGKDGVNETIESIVNQSYSNYEHIVAYDKYSGKMQDIMQQFPHVKWGPKNDAGFLQTFRKYISIARGDYVFYCNIGNGYLNQDWFNICIEILEINFDISLVWGLSQYVLDDGVSAQIVDSHFFDNPPFQKEYFLYYWLKDKTLFPEGNFCVRKNVLEKCFPFHDSKANDELEAWFAFNYQFNASGYLPYFVPIVANYRRMHSAVDRKNRGFSLELQRRMAAYKEDVECYKKQLITMRAIHRFRDGSNELLPGGFNHFVFLFFDLGRYIKAKLAKAYLLVMRKKLLFRKNAKLDTFSCGNYNV